VVLGILAETKSTRVMFRIGVVKCRVYELPEGYRTWSLFFESTKRRLTSSIY